MYLTKSGNQSEMNNFENLYKKYPNGLLKGCQEGSKQNRRKS
jgi:hypothetical protein